MPVSATRSEVLGLYKKFQRAASGWSHYGFREYTKIRARDAFKQNKGLTDPEAISKCIKEAKENLGIIFSQYLIFECLICLCIYLFILYFNW